MKRLFGSLWILLTLITLAANAQPLATAEMSLLAGKGELLTFDRDVTRVAISEPKIADALVVSPHEVMVNAKSPGLTTLMVWEQGSSPRRWDIRVKTDTTEEDKWRSDLRALIPESSVDISANGETLVLSGNVKSADESKRLGALAGTRYKNVVNLLQIPPAGDPRQIMLEVKFASIDRTNLAELGFNYFSGDTSKAIGTVGTQQFQSPRFTQLQLQGGQLGSTSVNFADLLNLFIFRPDLNIGATIRALQQRNLLQILAEPNLIAIEGSEASFLAGGQFPFPTLQSSSTGGAIAPVVTVQFKPFGVKLDFKPTVTASGAIHLKVRPEVSALDFANSVTLQGFLIPAVATRSAETEVVLRDGESFAIAGLIDNRVVQTLSRVRGLGDIPILGQLFRSRSTRKTTDELLVVITPHFVKPLSPEERAKLPDTLETFLPTVAEEAAKKSKEKPKAKFVGPRGHQEPR
jgi:pilus assembly protein CpaC